MLLIDGHLQVHILLKGVLDIEAQLKKLMKGKRRVQYNHGNNIATHIELEGTNRSLTSTTKKLETPKFIDNAKAAVLEETKQKKLDLQQKVETIQAQIREFKALV